MVSVSATDQSVVHFPWDPDAIGNATAVITTKHIPAGSKAPLSSCNYFHSEMRHVSLMCVANVTDNVLLMILMCISKLR